MEKTILIIEENPETLELLRRFLDKEGYKTIIATDGEKGLEYAQRLLPDLVLMERLLTKLNGLQVCKKLKEQGETKNIPVIFLSILDSENDIIESLKAGADDYIKKPFSPDELLARIERVIFRYSTLKQNTCIEKIPVEPSNVKEYKKNILEKLEGNLTPFCKKLFEEVEKTSERFKKVLIKIVPYTENPVSYCEKVSSFIKSSDRTAGQKHIQNELSNISRLMSFLTRARKNLRISFIFTRIIFKIEKELIDEKPGAFYEELKKRQKEIYSLILEIDKLKGRLTEVQSILSEYIKD